MGTIQFSKSLLSAFQQLLKVFFWNVFSRNRAFKKTFKLLWTIFTLAVVQTTNVCLRQANVSTIKIVLTAKVIAPPLLSKFNCYRVGFVTIFPFFFWIFLTIYNLIFKSFFKPIFTDLVKALFWIKERKSVKNYFSLELLLRVRLFFYKYGQISQWKAYYYHPELLTLSVTARVATHSYGINHLVYGRIRAVMIRAKTSKW